MDKPIPTEKLEDEFTGELEDEYEPKDKPKVDKKDLGDVDSRATVCISPVSYLPIS